MYLDVTLETLVDQSSVSASLSMAYTTLENALANRKWTPNERMCKGATILMNGPINSLLEFHFHRQPKPSLFISFDTKCSSANYKPAAVSSFNQVVSLHPKNSVEHWTSHTEMISSSRLAKAQQHFFVENRVVEPFQ